eukprot:TRINITY_DN22174_c0_g1_i1.p1 TRINITY_DN22174_c0_g1~~TRINITY_DN22174_c0_g1_i1.p1  ORF type:complete len:105 (-),score=56.26 TRINITY_DN22174_c0_g1_i1:60-374(-)
MFFFLMIRRPPRSTQSRSSAASDVYKRQYQRRVRGQGLTNMAEPDVHILPTISTLLESFDEIFELGAELGRGAFSTVYYAKRKDTQAEHALLSLIHISEPTRPY